jgi:hypothetical protein
MRVSRATFTRELESLQADVERRMFEGFWARVRRYFLDDPELRRRYKVAMAAKHALEAIERGESQ